MAAAMAGIGAAMKIYQSFADKRAAKKARKDQRIDREKALNSISFEEIMKQYNQLMPIFTAQNSPFMQYAMTRLQNAAGRTGSGSAGAFQQLKAGVPGQFANNAMMGALQQSIGLGQSRANIFQGMPTQNVPANQAAGVLGDYLMSMGSSFSGGGAKGGKPTSPTPQPGNSYNYGFI